ncbi:hypothetical protein VL21_19190 [Stenotrophomonas maltophilia]|nr:hypothetical protein VL21_19190 [Stenotrophomonas maltophilia]
MLATERPFHHRSQRSPLRTQPEGRVTVMNSGRSKGELMPGRIRAPVALAEIRTVRLFETMNR